MKIKNDKLQVPIERPMMSYNWHNKIWSYLLARRERSIILKFKQIMSASQKHTLENYVNLYEI